MTDLRSRVVDWDDGQTKVDYFSVTGIVPRLRDRIDGPAASIKRLTDSPRAAGHIDTASTLGFVVTPK
jgi:hypothetical protein